MASFNRTFRPKPIVNDEDDFFINNASKAYSPLKNTSLPFNIFFQDDEKLMGFYIGTLMTGQFMGIKACERPILNSKGISEGYVIDERELKVIFNSIFTIVKYFKVRYSKHPELIERFIKNRIPFISFSMFLSLSKVLKIYSEATMPENLKRCLEDWEFTIKISQELLNLERVQEVYNNDLFFQALHYYYYGTLMEPLVLTDPNLGTAF